MKSKLQLIAISILTLVALALSPAMAFAQVNPDSAKGAVCAGIGVSGNQCNNPAGAENTINDIIATVINILSILVGVVAVIFIIVGGFKYITSSGDTNATTSARSTILYAVVGLIIVALAQIIVQFVLNRITT